MSTISLSLEQYKLLDEAYKLFNNKLFNKELPECVIVLHRKKNARGYFHAERYVDRDSVKKAKKRDQIKSYDELAMNPDDFDRPDIAILSTLAHEMAHVWRHHCSGKEPSRGGYHDKLWGKKMEEIGLMPSSTGQEGGKKTGQKVTHYIIKNGKYEKLALHFLRSKKIKLSSFQISTSSSNGNRNKIKYSCPSCEMNVWGKPGVNIICGECEERLVEV